MKVLYVVGSNLTKNTSANISHNAYVQGLLEYNCEVDIIMAKSSWGIHDLSLPIFQEAAYYIYNSTPKRDFVRNVVKKILNKTSTATNEVKTYGIDYIENGKSIGSIVFSTLKKFNQFFLKTKSPYRLEYHWLKTASKFKSEKKYDLVISNSCPEASHKLVDILLKKNRINAKRWIQIWEDPWFLDIYGGMNERIKEEEHLLLKAASEVYYVSPLTLKYQQDFFSDCKDKMKHLPLPYLQISQNKDFKESECCFGYFGDYYSNTRNLLPFYTALKQLNFKGIICGDSDQDFKSDGNLTIHGRVSLERVIEYQSQSSVLVHLCNLRGQIPGKIYHYSATNKPILFILDGTHDERETLKQYFSQFNRYYFCVNSVKSILNALQELSSSTHSDILNTPVQQFSPRAVIKQLVSIPDL